MISKRDFFRLKKAALAIRIDSVRATTAAQSGHPTSCLSAADIIATLFFQTIKYNYKKPQFYNNDRFILSKGHAIPVVYAALKNLGIISDKDLLSLRKFDSNLEGHPTPRFKFNEAATGSLGQGLSIGVGMALNAKLENCDYTTFVMIGDGEAAEGSIWEAAELASKNKLNNLVGFLDCNRLGQSGESIHDHHVEHYAKKFEAFGWDAPIIDGHNIEEIMFALENARNATDKPTMIVAKTFKGHGLSYENENGFHGKPIKEKDLQSAINQLKKAFPEDVGFELSPSFTPQKPSQRSKDEKGGSKKISISIANDPHAELFEKDQKLATRKAYGHALASLGRVSGDIIALDADVKNSTFADLFEKEHPNRFVQCYIAEQNMIGMATGFELRGKIPFAATFACFLTRTFDHIRMAGVGRNALRLCGSHAGVSIGQDGPSQMGLEDIAMIRTVPNSIVFYPSDAVSTYKLVEHMANYNKGVSYIRTTRSDTPILYDKDEKFEIGGCHVLKQSKDDVACIVAAGITLHEALKAHEELHKKGISVSVIDTYSIKPLDSKTIIKTAKQSNNQIITVEDHYEAGGLGEAVMNACAQSDISVTSLCVRNISRSGKPEELLAFAEIDCDAIVKTVQKK